MTLQKVVILCFCVASTFANNDTNSGEIDLIDGMIDQIEAGLRQSSNTTPMATTTPTTYFIQRVKFLDARLQQVERIIAQATRPTVAELHKMLVNDSDFNDFPKDPTWTTNQDEK